MPRVIRGRLRSTYSTWPAAAEPVAYRGVLMDDQGLWWACEHRHKTGSEALRCADAQLALERPVR